MVEAATLMTADDLLRLPKQGYLYELVEGVLVTLNPAGSAPAITAARIVRRLDDVADRQKLGIVGGADWGFKLRSDPDTVRAPDAAFVCAGRIPSAGIPPGFWPGAPDLAVEVLSPSHTFAARLEKVQEYLDAGTRLVWLVEPDPRRLTVFRPGERTVSLHADDMVDGGDVLPGFHLLLSEIWV